MRWMFLYIEEISQINKRNRSKFEDLHCMGTKNLPRLIHEMTTKAIRMPGLEGVQGTQSSRVPDVASARNGSIGNNQQTTSDTDSLLV
ncbi:hypothetical protein MTR_7g071010 [Medicago truncatula]|uniref:Uncharacterized protein n=1 Tax=Medicago truncatula TaxID=3880 RepID=G7KV08_MEDTR|nr:hypothetical protein MTR_7g071010 [Medicago truncatula]